MDNFLNVHSYGDVEFDKYFAFAGIVDDSANGGNNYRLDLGYARHFGGIYLGALYSGNIGSSIHETQSGSPPPPPPPLLG
ncbi:MAG: hypothetical protein LBQ88_22690 [Treponema sp.]|nr:hypothetical protein [Treponema sp.]